MKGRLIVVVGILLMGVNILVNYGQGMESLVVEEDEIIEWNSHRGEMG